MVVLGLHYCHLVAILLRTLLVDLLEPKSLPNDSARESYQTSWVAGLHQQRYAATLDGDYFTIDTTASK